MGRRVIESLFDPEESVKRVSQVAESVDADASIDKT